MIKYLANKSVADLVATLIVIFASSVGNTTQLDYKGSERISRQEWQMQFVLRSMGEDNYSVRLPFPDYTYIGRWDSYLTHEVSVSAVGLCGPITYELYPYNQGYSNQGVWLKPVFDCAENEIFLTVKQSAKLDLPGLDYPLTLHTNNGWMSGSEIIDVNSPVIANVLSEALSMSGEWHQMGWRSIPEKIVNWMNQNMIWGGNYSLYPKPASQVLIERIGHCEEWAHAACALLIKSGIPAKSVMVGTLPTYNSTGATFESADWHLCVAYWDGFGWILIDPQFSSGFAIPNRVILGADRDSRNLRLITNPEYLLFYISDIQYSYSEGSHSGYLDLEDFRCFQYPWEILEHYEYSSGSSPQGSEPKNNIVPNIQADVQSSYPVPASHQFSNYPNPFNPATTFRFTVISAGMVKIALYTVEGKYIETIYSRYCEPGLHEISWQSNSIRSGIYIARITTPSGVETRKVVMLK